MTPAEHILIGGLYLLAWFIVCSYYAIWYKLRSIERFLKGAHHIEIYREVRK